MCLFLCAGCLELTGYLDEVRQQSCSFLPVLGSPACLPCVQAYLASKAGFEAMFAVREAKQISKLRDFLLHPFPCKQPPGSVGNPAEPGKVPVYNLGTFTFEEEFKV